MQNIFCEQCPKGTSAHDWENVCHQCHPGYYSAGVGAIDCEPCQAGEFCRKKG